VRDLEGRHFATVRLARHFSYIHLPLPLQQISRPCGELAQLMITVLPDSPELTTGLRKLLEAKDSFVRAAVEDED